jgi:fermentation-respiration switch protein FrsA (DUF1100 family)
MKKLLIGLVTTCVVLYAASIAFIVLDERSLVYHPGERTVHPPSPVLALRQREVTFPAADGPRLHAWVIPAASRDSSGVWMLICHGNYGNIGYGDRPPFYAGLRDLGLNLLAFDYRGFGASEGAPSESGVYRDARAAYQYLRDTIGVRPEQIILFGHSLGTGVAIELASHVPAAGVVLEAPYTSIPDRGQEIYPFLPITLIARNRFASIDRVPQLATPKLVLHAPGDDVIPYAHGQRVFAAAARPKRFVTVRGTHSTAFREDSARYYGAIAQFVKDVMAAPVLAGAAAR